MSLFYTSFPTVALAESAIGALMDHGVAKEDISVVADERHNLASGDGASLEDIESKGKTGITTTTGKDAAAGAAKGAGVGVVVGVLGALASLAIPGFGLVIGGGALAMALASAAGTAVGGAFAGGIAGYLDDQGVPTPIAVRYQDVIKNGGALLAVTLPSGKCDEVLGREMLAKYQGADFHQDSRPVGAVIPVTTSPTVVSEPTHSQALVAEPPRSLSLSAEPIFSQTTVVVESSSSPTLATEPTLAGGAKIY